ncbi:MAG: hypothetical protein WCC57_18910 [Paracoccaceae bacterium]
MQLFSPQSGPARLDLRQEKRRGFPEQNRRTCVVPVRQPQERKVFMKGILAWAIGIPIPIIIILYFADVF